MSRSDGERVMIGTADAERALFRGIIPDAFLNPHLAAAGGPIERARPVRRGVSEYAGQTQNRLACA